MPRPKKTDGTIVLKTKAPRRKRNAYNSTSRPMVMGKGDYKSFVKSVANTIEKMTGDPTGPIGKAGSSIGKALGFPTIGRIAGNILGKLTGLGDYKTNADNIRYNSLFSKNVTGVQVPEFASHKEATRIVHREYIGDLVAGPTGSPTSFNTWNIYDMNPALLDTFAWLSQVAQNYDTYKFNGIVFEYKAMSGSATGANTQLGNVIFSAQYNAANKPFTNKLEMENYEGACSVNPSENMLFGIECNPNDVPETHLYTRAGAVPAGQSQQLYDLCQLQISTQGIPTASQILGEIWVSYDVSLYQPKLFAGQVGNAVLTAQATSTSGVSGAGNHFGTVTYAPQNTLDINLVQDGSHNSSIQFDTNIVTGNYLITYAVLGSSVTAVAPTLSYSNCSPLNLFGIPSNPLNTIGLGNTTVYMQDIYISINNTNGQGAVVEFQNGTLPGSVGGNFMNLTVTQISGLVTPQA